MDFGLGSRGFSHRGSLCILEKSSPGRWGDAEWPVLIKRSGFKVTYCTAHGVDWETPDRYRTELATPEARRREAKIYDQVAENWATRVQIASEIIQQGLDALKFPLI